MSSNLRPKFINTLYNRAWLALCNSMSHVHQLREDANFFNNLNGSKTLYRPLYSSVLSGRKNAGRIQVGLFQKKIGSGLST